MMIILVYILQVMVRVSRLIYVKHLEQNLHIEALNKGLPLYFYEHSNLIVEVQKSQGSVSRYLS